MACLNIWALVACRVVIGFFEVSHHLCTVVTSWLTKLQGTIIPTTNAMFGKWAPPLERSIMGTFGLAGTISTTGLSIYNCMKCSR